MLLSGFELGTFCVLGRRIDHYTMEQVDFNCKTRDFDFTFHNETRMLKEKDTC